MLRPVFDLKDDRPATWNELLYLVKTGQSGLFYSYGLLGYLHSFKRTAKGVSCYDSLGNYIYMQPSRLPKLYLNSFMCE